MPIIAQFISPFPTASSSPKTSTPHPHPHPMANDTLLKSQSTVKTPSCFIDKVKNVMEKVKQVALFILKTAISVLLYWVNPSLFAVGFMAGIIFDDQVRYAIQKIKDVWKTQKFTGTLFGGIACVLSMPVSIASASLVWSAHLGSLMSAEAQKIKKCLATSELRLSA